MEKLTCSISEFAETMGISKTMAYSLASKGMIPIIKIEGRKLIAKNTIEKILLKK